MLSAHDISFSYQSHQPPIIEGFSHTFAPGVTLLGGPSGCGKSTLLYLLGLMLSPTRGRVLVGGEDLSSLGDAQRSRHRAERIGFVFQDAVLDPSRTVLDNVVEAGLYSGMAKRESVRRACALLGEFGVEARERHRPGEISGGQAQRVALCRALLKGPKIVLADEPTGNLDAVSADAVWEALASAGQSGVTVVIATHDVRRLREAEGVVMLG